MSPSEHPLQGWLSGLPRRPLGACAARSRTVVLEAPPVVAAHLLHAHLTNDSTLTFIGARRAETAESASPGRLRRFTGSFLSSNTDIVVDDGYRLQVRHYGAAEFVCFDQPTALRISDGDDFSGYLRDADHAWQRGIFAPHTTHPNAIIADLVALGGPFAQAGPDHRLFVGPGGQVSTSPTGTVLGHAGDDPDVLDDRWVGLNSGSSQPDATCLSLIVSERDRADALAERPWIRRYVSVLEVLKGVRRDTRTPTRVSGFGSRITTSTPGQGRADSTDAPIILAVGDHYQTHDPWSEAMLTVSGDDVALMEALLNDLAGAGHPNRMSARRNHDVPDPGGRTAAVLGRLSTAGVATMWCRTAEAELARSPENS